MSIHENKQEGINNGIRWKYEESFNKKIYQGLLYSEHQLIGNSELRLVLEEECPSPHYLWYFLSDFFIHSEHKRQGFGKIMLEKLLDFAKKNEIAILKNFAHAHFSHFQEIKDFLLSHGFNALNENVVYYTHDGIEEKGK